MENTLDSIIDTKLGDVTGDGILDEISLVGTQTSGSHGENYFNNITLRVTDGKDNKTTYLRFKFNSGYSPKIILGDFTSNNTADIFISINSNPSTGEYFYYLFSFLDNTPKSLFNFMQFNEFSKYDVIFKDYYEVQIKGVNSNMVFSISIRDKDESYLSKLYGKDGKLIEPKIGSVLPLGNLFPVDVNDDNVLELLALQRIVGTFSNDTLGYVQTFLSFNGKFFSPGLIMVSLTGKNPK